MARTKLSELLQLPLPALSIVKPASHSSEGQQHRSMARFQVLQQVRRLAELHSLLLAPLPSTATSTST